MNREGEKEKVNLINPLNMYTAQLSIINRVFDVGGLKDYFSPV